MPDKNDSTDSPYLKNVREEGDAILATLHGEIDLHNSPDLRGNLMRLLEAKKPKRLILNLTDVPYMDSSAIAVLVETLQRVRKNSGNVYLTNLSSRVKGLLEIARLETIFVIAKDEEEAKTKK